MEFPPFIAWLGKLSYVFFDYSLMGTRLFPTMAGVAIIILSCLIAKELKANNTGLLLAGICVLAFLPFYRNHTLFQPVAFDQLFWTLGFFSLIKFINTENQRYLLLMGITLGIGLLNKYTMLIWAFGIFIGMIFHRNGLVFKNRWWYLSGLLSAAIISPNLNWQFQNKFPLLRHMEALHESQLSQLNVFEFGLEQLNYPITLVVSILGAIYLIRSKKYNSLGIAAIIIFFTMWILQSKPYYVFALHPLLFAAGAAQLSKWLSGKNIAWSILIAVIVLTPTLIDIPHATPVLSIDRYVNYSNLKETNGRIELTGDYADMFGWEEQVEYIDSLYQAIAKIENKSCVLWAENYGEAGALKIIGKRYGLPNPISRHGSFWKWGYGNPIADVWISLGNERAAVEYIFEETELVKTIYHKYAIGEENGIPIYICRNPKLNIQQWWKDYEPYIFD